MQAEMPFLLMVRMAEVETFSVIHSPVSGRKNFLVCKFGLNLRFVFLLEKETLFPTILAFPVKSQMRDMIFHFFIKGGQRWLFFTEIQNMYYYFFKAYLFGI